MSRMVSFAVLLGILVVIAVLFYRVMVIFLLPLFMAALLFVVFQPLFRWVIGKLGDRRYLAAAATTFLVLVSVLVPIGLVSSMAAMQGLTLVEQLRVENFRDKIEGLRKQFGLDIDCVEDLRRIEATLDHWHQQERQGETPSFSPETIQNLLDRVEVIEQFTKVLTPPSTSIQEESLIRLRDSLRELIPTAPDSRERDETISRVQSEYHTFKLAFLGGAFNTWLKEQLNPSDDQIDELRSRFISSARSPLISIGSDTASFLLKVILGLVITLTTLFFLFAEGAKMLNAAIRLSPLEEKYVRELVEEFDRVCRAVVAATLLSAIAQGLLAGIGFYFADLQGSVALLMLLTMFLAMVPFTGAATVWVPVCLYLYFVENNKTTAVLLAAYCAGIVSTIDNFIKPLVLHGQSNLHPLLALLSVIGGIQALGPIGILIGPMVVVFLQTLLRILQRELLSMDRLAAAAAAVRGEPAPAGPAIAKVHSPEGGAGPSSGSPHVSSTAKSAGNSSTKPSNKTSQSTSKKRKK